MLRPNLKTWDLPGWRFHRLHGDLKGHYSVWLNGNWRITFEFNDEPQDVDLVDYHQEGVNVMAMKNPVHPGSIIREDFIGASELTVTDAARP